MTCLPLYEDDGKRLLHFGGSYSIRHPNKPISLEQRPETHRTAHLAEVVHLDVGRVHLVGIEAAYVDGPFSLQGEYMGEIWDVSGIGDTYLQGLYVQASYFLTGEHRLYNRRRGVFAGVRPGRAFPKNGGRGAWEIATRYSFLDLNDSGLPNTARTLHDVTFGLNWYLNPHMRIMWNYIRSCVDGPDTTDAADIFMVRFQLTF
jgi:phosphate-selective porin OprO/OprP